MQVYDNQNEPAVLMVLKSIFIKYTPSNFFEHMQSTQHALQKKHTRHTRCARATF